MLGTKWPSITSRWIQSAPAWSTARTSSPSLAKSDARIDGAITRGRGVNGWDMGAFPDKGANPCPPNTGQWRGQSARKILPRAASLAGDAGPYETREPLFYRRFRPWHG